MPPNKLKYAVGADKKLPLPSSFEWRNQPEFDLEGIGSAEKLEEAVLQRLQLDSCMIYYHGTRFLAMGVPSFLGMSDDVFDQLQEGDWLYINDTRRVNRKQLVPVGRSHMQQGACNPCLNVLQILSCQHLGQTTVVIIVRTAAVSLYNTADTQHALLDWIPVLYFTIQWRDRLHPAIVYHRADCSAGPHERCAVY